jgi:transcriptional regulator with XRE-family HTH domain
MLQQVANRRRVVSEGSRHARRIVANVADELREARLARGLTLAQVGRAIGVSASHICRTELGLRSPAVEELVVHAAAVGLRPSIKLYPIGGALRDQAQVKYIAKFVGRLGHAWRVRLDVAIPLPGDLRGIDVLLEGSCVVAVEVITRLRDLQAQLRAAQLKQRDIGADRLIVVLAGTHANRVALAEARASLLATFDLDSRRVLGLLTAGQDPGSDAVIVLD